MHVNEDEVQAQARALARAEGLDPDEIVEAPEPEPLAEDRGDGVPVVSMRRPLRARWTEFVPEARRRVELRMRGEGEA